MPPDRTVTGRGQCHTSPAMANRGRILVPRTFLHYWKTTLMSMVVIFVYMQPRLVVSSNTSDEKLRSDEHPRRQDDLLVDPLETVVALNLPAAEKADLELGLDRYPQRVVKQSLQDANEAAEDPIAWEEQGDSNDDDISEEPGRECFLGEEASWQLKTWFLTGEGFPPEIKLKTIKFYETDLTLIRSGSGGAAWYLIGGGWQGALYYESGKPGQSRPGAYLYPDFYTAVVGLWLDHVLLQGRVTELGRACFLRSSSTWELEFMDFVGPVLGYSPPLHHSLGIKPLEPDPYEVRTVRVARSLIPGAHDGLFTTRDIMSGEVLAFYSGYIISCDSSLRALDRREYSDDEEHVRNMYNIAMDLAEGENLCIDLPPQLGNDLQKYNATLGHKVNHSFEPNSEFVLFSGHPILGTIMALAAVEDLSAGTEVTVNYGYNFTSDPDQPEWFIRQWKIYYGENGKNERKLENDFSSKDHGNHEEL